jgi:hypothetical protein
MKHSHKFGPWKKYVFFERECNGKVVWGILKCGEPQSTPLIPLKPKAWELKLCDKWVRDHPKLAAKGFRIHRQ